METGTAGNLQNSPALNMPGDDPVAIRNRIAAIVVEHWQAKEQKHPDENKIKQLEGEARELKRRLLKMRPLPKGNRHS